MSFLCSCCSLTYIFIIDLYVSTFFDNDKSLIATFSGNVHENYEDIYWRVANKLKDNNSFCHFKLFPKHVYFDTVGDF